MKNHALSVIFEKAAKFEMDGLLLQIIGGVNDCLSHFVYHVFFYLHFFSKLLLSYISHLVYH